MAETEAEAMNGVVLPMACSASFLVQLSTICQGQHHRHRALLHQSLIKKYPTGQADRGIFSIGVPTSQTTLACIKLTNKQPPAQCALGFGVR